MIDIKSASFGPVQTKDVLFTVTLTAYPTIAPFLHFFKILYRADDDVNVFEI